MVEPLREVQLQEGAPDRPRQSGEVEGVRSIVTEEDFTKEEARRDIWLHLIRVSGCT